MFDSYLKYWLYLSLVVAMGVTGCAGQKITLSQYIDTGYKVAEDYTMRTTKLIDANAISESDAKQRQKNSKAAEMALNTAKEVRGNCRRAGISDNDCAAAWASAEGAYRFLGMAEDYVIKQGGK